MFKDFLEWYNNLDVLPFVEAIEKMKEFYKLKRLDIFKDGVSLPGLVLKYLTLSYSTLSSTIARKPHVYSSFFVYLPQFYLR